jgi:hypothetical protein
MTNAFTFKTSPLSLMSLRLWFVRLEIKRRMKRLARLPKEISDLAEYDLRGRTIDLYRKVGVLWDHFDVFPPGLLPDEFIIDGAEINEVYSLNYYLTQEFDHYDQMRRWEEAAKKRLTRRAHALLPNWIKLEESWVKWNANDAKYSWKDRWLYRYFPVSLGSENVIDAVVASVFGGTVLSIIMVFYSLFMFYKDQWLSAVAKMLADQAAQNNTTFLQVYTGFGAAVIIGISLMVGLLFSWSILFRKVGDIPNLPDALADIAYAVETKVPARTDVIGGADPPHSGMIN